MHPPIQLRDRQGRRKYLTPHERKLFFAHTKTLPTRQRLFCQTLYYTGCRVSEALSLGPYSADIEGKVVTFRTLKRQKDEHQRSVPVPAQFVRELQSLGEHPFPFSRTTAWRIIKRAMLECGIIGPQATTKGLRHGFAIKCATENAVISKIQVWMGHASPMTTMIYLDAVGAEERDFIRRTWD